MRSYTIVLTAEPDGSAYNVQVPAIDGCVTYGVTVEDAIIRAREVIVLMLNQVIEDGEEVPDDVQTLVTTVDVDIEVSKLTVAT
jgi:predicted RNase H-like HicB family nuclease